MNTYQAFGQEQAMSGLSDVRLVLKPEALRQGAVAEHLYGQKDKSTSAVGRWRLFCRRLATRRALLTLSDEQLKDVGLSRAQAQREALCPFWAL
ncbi:DUF1127 domain-containing protein [Pseudomonas leptonychotis]|uniref:DUF1127 domain-containing protein n=1 Tax=Pseudomonas leptonychotis TaxID=2448482 RepID=UPI0039EF7662